MNTEKDKVIMSLGKIDYEHYEYQDHDWKDIAEMKR